MIERKTGYVDKDDHIRLINSRVTMCCEHESRIITFDAWPSVHFALDPEELLAALKEVGLIP